MLGTSDLMLSWRESSKSKIIHGALTFQLGSTGSDRTTVENLVDLFGSSNVVPQPLKGRLQMHR